MGNLRPHFFCPNGKPTAWHTVCSSPCRQSSAAAWDKRDNNMFVKGLREGVEVFWVISRVGVFCPSGSFCAPRALCHISLLQNRCKGRVADFRNRSQSLRRIKCDTPHSQGRVAAVPTGGPSFPQSGTAEKKSPVFSSPARKRHRRPGAPADQLQLPHKHENPNHPDRVPRRSDFPTPLAAHPAGPAQGG